MMSSPSSKNTKSNAIKQTTMTSDNTTTPPIKNDLDTKINKEVSSKVSSNSSSDTSFEIKRYILERKLPKTTSGVVITKIEKDSPLYNLEVNNIIVEAQKKKINTIGDLDNIVKMRLRSSEKTLLIAIYNNQNQRRYIGVKLN